MNTQLGKRIQSLLWRAGALGAVAFVSALVDGLPDLELNTTIAAIIALGLAEVTKYLNRK